MKKKFTTLLAACVLALPSVAAELPFTESFYSGFGEFTYEDANKDDNTFKLTYSGYDYTRGVLYEASSSNPADDWLFTPALPMKKGHIYTMTYQYKCKDYAQKLEWKAGNAAESTAMNVEIVPTKEYPSQYMYQQETIKITVPSDGNWHLGLHLTSEAAKGNFYIDEIEISAGVNAKAPTAPQVSEPTFAVSGEKLTAAFEITLPSVNNSGDTLAGEELTVRVTRGDKEGETDTVTGMPGETVTFVDQDASLERITYTFTCISGDDESPAVEIVSSPRLGTPKQVTGFTAVQEGTKFTLSWDAVTEPVNASDTFFASHVTYTVKSDGNIVAQNTTDTSAEYTFPMPEDGQETVQFSIFALADGQQSAVSFTPAYMIGNPYEGEFCESFANTGFTKKIWYVQDNKTNWTPSPGNYSDINPQDNDGGCLKFFDSTNEELRINSPILDLRGMVNPKLKFWVFLDPSSYYEPQIQPAFLTDGEETLLGQPINIKSGETKGWTEFTYDIPESALNSTTQLVFVGFGGTYGSVFIDNLSIKSYLEHNIAVTATSPKNQFEVGKTYTIPVTVTNKGVNDEQTYSIRLLANDVEVANIEGPAVSAISVTQAELNFTAYPKYAGSDVTLKVEALMESDMDTADNTSEFSVPVNENELPVVPSLSADPDGERNTVALSWEAPEVSPEPVLTEVFESFEEWEAGSIEPSNDWIFIDADEVAQAGVNNVNDGKTFAAMVAENYEAPNYYSSSLESHEGTHCLAITKAYSYASIDNWVILPEMKGGTTMTFQAMTFGSSWSSIESFDLMQSEGGVNVEDFTLLRTIKSEIESINTWTEITVEVPENVSRIAIRKSGNASSALMFDSFRFTTETNPPMHIGYNLYRNHELITTLPAESDSYLDESAETGKEHLYKITALYDKGESMYNEKDVLVSIFSGLDAIDADMNDAEYYNLSGIRISSPRSGDIVIVRNAGRTFKAIVR